MSGTIFLSRNARMVVLWEGGVSASNRFEIPILEGFSFSQSTNTAEVTLSEATSSGISRRGRKVFNNSLAPVEFSFQTYVRPFKSGGSGVSGHAIDVQHSSSAVEAVLWAMMAGADTYDPTTTGLFDRVAAPAGAVVTSGTTDASTAASLNVSFGQSNIPQLYTTADILFEIEEEDGSGVITYLLDEAVINEATIDFDIEGIATISWSGMAKSITEGTAAVTSTVNEGTGIDGKSSANFIQNRLSTLTIDGSSAKNNTAIADSYDLTLTGGSITISNNLTFLTPEEIGRVNAPIGHVTGTRNVTGTLTCYLDQKAGGSADLFEDISQSTTDIVNEFNISINIGGTTGPCLIIDVDHANFQIPTHSFDDVVSVEVTFDGLPGSMDTADEVSLEYKTSTTTLS